MNFSQKIFLEFYFPLYTSDMIHGKSKKHFLGSDIKHGKSKNPT